MKALFVTKALLTTSKAKNGNTPRDNIQVYQSTIDKLQALDSNQYELIQEAFNMASNNTGGNPDLIDVLSCLAESAIAAKQVSKPASKDKQKAASIDDVIDMQTQINEMDVRDENGTYPKVRYNQKLITRGLCQSLGIGAAKFNKWLLENGNEERLNAANAKTIKQAQDDGALSDNYVKHLANGGDMFDSYMLKGFNAARSVAKKEVKAFNRGSDNPLPVFELERDVNGNLSIVDTSKARA